jgi:hypothetical protein
LLLFPLGFCSIGDEGIPGMTRFDWWGAASGLTFAGVGRCTVLLVEASETQRILTGLYMSTYNLSCRDAVPGTAISTRQMVPFPFSWQLYW